jgi:hypothetical protein
VSRAGVCGVTLCTDVCSTTHTMGKHAICNQGRLSWCWRWVTVALGGMCVAGPRPYPGKGGLRALALVQRRCRKHYPPHGHLWPVRVANHHPLRTQSSSQCCAALRCAVLLLCVVGAG